MADSSKIEWTEASWNPVTGFGVPAFVKQLGAVWARGQFSADRKGGDPDVWPADLRVRQYPEAVAHA